MNEAKLTFSVPSSPERGWYRFDQRRKAWKPSSRPGGGQPVGYVYSAFDCISIPMWVNSESAELIPKLARFEIERLTGQVVEEDSSRLLIRKIARKDSHILIHVTIIDDDLVGSLGRNWQRFSVSPHFVEGGDGEIHLWQEEGRWVAGFFLKGILIHWHAFGIGDLSAQHVSELNCISRDLVVRRICAPPRMVCVRGQDEIPAELSNFVVELMGIPIESVKGRQGQLMMPKFDADLKPGSLIDYQIQRGKRHNQLLLYLFLVLLVIGGAFVAWFDIYRLKKEIVELQVRADLLAPQAARIRDSRDRWEAVTPAINSEHFPVEIFHRIAVLLPPKGIRLTEFEIRGGKITVRGEASNVPTAIKFKADLEKTPGLSQFEWQVPQPLISGDTAKFVAFGIPRNQVNISKR